MTAHRPRPGVREIRRTDRKIIPQLQEILRERGVTVRSVVRDDDGSTITTSHGVMFTGNIAADLVGVDRGARREALEDFVETMLAGARVGSARFDVDDPLLRSQLRLCLRPTPVGAGLTFDYAPRVGGVRELLCLRMHNAVAVLADEHVTGREEELYDIAYENMQQVHAHVDVLSKAVLMTSQDMIFTLHGDDSLVSSLIAELPNRVAEALGDPEVAAWEFVVAAVCHHRLVAVSTDATLDTVLGFHEAVEAYAEPGEFLGFFRTRFGVVHEVADPPGRCA